MKSKETLTGIHWYRIAPIQIGGNRAETWICKDALGEKQYDVEVTLGKRIDILSLKGRSLADFKAHVSQVRESRRSLYRTENLRRIGVCPICEHEVEDGNVILVIYGAKYHQCSQCSHCFVLDQPDEMDLREFYSRNDSYQATYADDRTSQIRVEQVAAPKAKWLIRQFERVHGRKPKSILDVGAGSGHFVRACSDLGIRTSGIEISKSGREYSRDHFGLELSGQDFVKEWQNFEDYEVITFWGLIEHVPYPMEMLRAASRILSDKSGMVVAEVPRLNCMGTVVQTLFPDSIVRHLDPLGHINCFTVSSLSTAFRLSKFAVVAAWYFGMDAYELARQLSLLLNRDDMTGIMKKHIPDLQERMDQAKLSDQIVLAGIPARFTERD